MADTDSTALLTAGGIAAGAGSAVGGEKAIRAIVAKVKAVRAEKKRLREVGSLPPGFLERRRLEREALEARAQATSVVDGLWPKATERRRQAEIANLMRRGLK